MMRRMKRGLKIFGVAAVLAVILSLGASKVFFTVVFTIVGILYVTYYTLKEIIKMILEDKAKKEDEESAQEEAQ